METSGLSQLLEIGGPVVAVSCFSMWIVYKLVSNHLKTMTGAITEHSKTIHRMVEHWSRIRAGGSKP